MSSPSDGGLGSARGASTVAALAISSLSMSLSLCLEHDAAVNITESPVLTEASPISGLTNTRETDTSVQQAVNQFFLFVCETLKPARAASGDATSF